MRLGSLSSPPAPATRPRLTSGNPNLASSLATTRSQASTSSKPPARAYPSTAAITGFAGGRSTIPPKPRPAAIGASPARKPLRSMPALKVPPAPVSTRTLTSPRLSKSSIAPAMPRATSPLTALRACGLSIVMTATLSATSVRIASAIAVPPDRRRTINVARGRLSMRWPGLLGLESDAAVEPDHFGIHVVVVDQRPDELGELGRGAHPLGKDDWRDQLRLEIIARRAGTV